MIPPFSIPSFARPYPGLAQRSKRNRRSAVHAAPCRRMVKGSCKRGSRNVRRNSCPVKEPAQGTPPISLALYCMVPSRVPSNPQLCRQNPLAESPSRLSSHIATCFSLLGDSRNGYRVRRRVGRRKENGSPEITHEVADGMSEVQEAQNKGTYLHTSRTRWWKGCAYG